MLKPDSLRAAIVAAIPDLGKNPDRLAIFIDRGTIAGVMAAAPDHPNPGFEYRYTLNAVLQDYGDHPDKVIAAVMTWLHVHQPDLLQRPDRPPLKFEADIVSADAIDISIEIELTEAVRATPRQGGGYDLVHLAEPPAIEEFEGVPRWTPLERVYIQNELIIGEPDG